MPSTYVSKTKVCPQCLRRKRITPENFHTNRRGNVSWCRQCDVVAAVAWAKKNPERAKRNRKNHMLRKRYGITLEQFEIRLAAQGGVCAVCRKPPRGKDPKQRVLHIDHDHLTGKIRDLLCFTCNAGIGSMMDSPTLLRAAADYLESHGTSS